MTTQPTDPLPFRVASFLLRPPGLSLASPRTGIGHHDHIVRVQVVGELDVTTASTVTAELIDAARGHALRASWAVQPAIELDLKGLTFLDSSGITALDESRATLLEMGCGLCLSFPQLPVLRLLDFAICAGWLSSDIECASYHPWPPVIQPLRVRAAMSSRRLPYRAGHTSPTGSLSLVDEATTSQFALR